MKYIIIYDIPREKKTLQVQINRLLHRIKAERIQHSVWESEDLESLRLISEKIEEANGKTIILEKKVV
jgi:CRISPR-associated endonuclease Cas2